MNEMGEAGRVETIERIEEEGRRRETILLRYRIGGLPLFSMTLSALVEDEYTTASGDGSSLPQPRALPSGVEVLLWPSFAVERDPPLWQVKGAILRYVPQCYRRCTVDLRGTFDEYRRRALSPKSRSTLGRKVRRFTAESGGEIEWREFHSVEEMPELYALARQVSMRTYQEHLYDAGVPSGDGFVERLREWAAKDQVRGFILFRHGRPIAYLVCPADGDVLRAQYFGYDPDYHKSSPGAVLQYLALQRLFEEGRFRLLDFTKGDGQHKAVFASDSVLCADIYDFALTPKNVLLVVAHACLSIGGRWVSRALDYLQLKSRVRRWIRIAGVGGAQTIKLHPLDGARSAGDPNYP